VKEKLKWSQITPSMFLTSYLKRSSFFLNLEGNKCRL
jgi:hypothetical protein